MKHVMLRFLLLVVDHKLIVRSLLLPLIVGLSRLCCQSVDCKYKQYGMIHLSSMSLLSWSCDKRRSVLPSEW